VALTQFGAWLDKSCLFGYYLLPTFASENRETQLVWNTPSGGFLDGDLAVADPDNKLATSICHTAWIDMKRWLRRQQGLTTHPIM
jgi:hypothetical protein